MDRKVRLLIVEQHAAVRRALAYRLQSVDPIEVVGLVETVRGARELLAATGAEVVLLGLQPRRKEYLASFIEQVAALVALNIPVIALTSYVDDDERVGLHAAGVKRYLLKHIDTPHLVSEIMAVINGKSIPAGK